MAFEIWENFTADGIFNYAISAYANVDPWMWPLVFVGIIGFIYGATQSLIVTVAGIIITMASFVGTSIFTDVPEVPMLFYIITIVGIGVLLTALFIQVRR